MTRDDLQNGQVFLIAKEKHWTSMDVLRKMQSIYDYKKFGHAGTLDPLASGLLIVCSGKKTKIIEQLQNQEKEYQVEFILGASTITYDSEFAPETIQDTSQLDLDRIQTTIDNSFVGEILQVPPPFSAVKIKGKRAYAIARKGKPIVLEPRIIVVSNFYITSCTKFLYKSIQLTRCTAVITCSKGTYIRSLIHDLGFILKVGGYVQELNRTKIGRYRLAHAVKLSELPIVDI